MSPIDLCYDNYVQCWSSGCVTKKTVDSDPVLVNANASSFVGIDVKYARSCDDFSDPWSDPKCSETSCLNNGTCQQSWSGYKYVSDISFLSLSF